MIEHAGEQIKKHLQKKQDALNKFIAQQEAFLLAKQQIITEIEEARNTWIKTLEQLPKQEFNY